MSFFSCYVDRERFAAANPRLPLYPGQVNTWVVTFQAQASDADVRRALSLFWLLLDLPMSTTGARPEIRALELKAWQVGPPTKLPAGTERLRELPDTALPPSHIFAVISFVYAGSLTELKPWPWLSRGFVIQCPEDVMAGVLAVLPPSAPPIEAKPTGTVDQLSNIASSLSTASRVVIWGGAALLLFKLHQLTR